MCDSLNLLKVIKLFNNLDGAGIMAYLAPFYGYKTCKDRKHTYWVWQGKCGRGTYRFTENDAYNIDYITSVKIDYVTLVEDEFKDYKLKILGRFEYTCFDGKQEKQNFSYKEKANGTTILGNYKLMFLMKLFLYFIDMGQEIELEHVTKKMTGVGYRMLGFEHFQCGTKSYHTYVHNNNSKNMAVLAYECCRICLGDFTTRRSSNIINSSMYFPITVNGVELASQYGLYINKESKLKNVLN